MAQHNQQHRHHHHLYTNTSAQSSHIIYLDATHIVEVRKYGTQIGIYTITTTGKKRGILLPIDTWKALDKLRNLVNVTVDLAEGSLPIDKIEQTLLPHQHLSQPQQNVSWVSTVNNNNNARQPVYTLFTNSVKPTATTTTPSTTTTTTTTNDQGQLLYQPDIEPVFALPELPSTTSQTFPILEQYTDWTQSNPLLISSTIGQDTETYDNTYDHAYGC